MYQMLILLLFNNSFELTIEQVQNETQIKIDLLLQILNILFKSKILICTESIDQVHPDMNSIIKLSNDFTR
jgi:cullin 1